MNTKNHQPIDIDQKYKRTKAGTTYLIYLITYLPNYGPKFHIFEPSLIFQLHYRRIIRYMNKIGVSCPFSLI